METGLREDKKRGLAVVLREGRMPPLCLAKAVYDQGIQCWKPDYACGLRLSDFRLWPKKEDAVRYASDLHGVTNFGVAFRRKWGLRWNLRYSYFLAVDWDDEKIDSVVRVGEKKKMKIKKDELFMFSGGEYSDYMLYVLCKTKVDIDIEALKEEYLAQNPDERQKYGAEFHKFVKWVIDKNLAEKIKYKEWYLGGYDTYEFSLGERK
ncbi:MAG: hypothetical protein OCU18_03855 [Candidatus Syntrophoarchaeum sp.]|nr:hypothetical protein [Candidatus Syntrophoarchaeum sp.]